MSENNNSRLPLADSNIHVMSLGYITLNNEEVEDIEDTNMGDIDMVDVNMVDVNMGDEDGDIDDEDSDYEDTVDEDAGDKPIRTRTQESQQMNTPEGNITLTRTAGSSNTPEDSERPTTSVGADNANASISIPVTSEKDDKYKKMIEELTTKMKIIHRIRLPVHPSACIVCRLCLVCSHKYGQAACHCASLGEGTPKKGCRLLPFMTDSRVVVGDFACKDLRKFTIDWVEKNAHKIYQSLHYANAVPAGYISVCSANSSKYFSDCKGRFGNAKNAKRLGPDSAEYQKYEEERKNVVFPPGIFEYVMDRRAGWNQSRVDMHKRLNKSKFYLLCLDSCDSVPIDEAKIMGKHSQVTNVKRKAADEPEKSNKRAKKTKDSSLTEDDPDSMTVSIWNAPSLETYSANDSYNLFSALLYLPDFKAADVLVFESINFITSVDKSQVRFHFVKNYESDIQMQSLLFNESSDEMFNGNHLDLYIGTGLQR
ncbi:hypothetical protein HPULCUR_000917 [Helicostylum pulchrum]|uniref:Uncharacterized protein n=1 Tax=Helicostylum pulchrum TaxID=562976 RepID=A0ABP9XL73_9FUNG